MDNGIDGSMTVYRILMYYQCHSMNSIIMKVYNSAVESEVGIVSEIDDPFSGVYIIYVQDASFAFKCKMRYAGIEVTEHAFSDLCKCKNSTITVNFKMM